jgi:FKBP-type peptidyl-prolyl cis-trans isomerase SlyD
MNIVKDTVVTLNYEVFDLEGNSLEKSDEPIHYLHGGYDNIFPLVEQALEGKAAGDTVEIKLQPADAFGDYDEELVRVEPREMFPETVEAGMQFVGAPVGSEQEVLYTVTDVAEDKVVVDGNHPLAGESVRFTCVVTEVRKAEPGEIEHGHAHGAHGHHHH